MLKYVLLQVLYTLQFSILGSCDALRIPIVNIHHISLTVNLHFINLQVWANFLNFALFILLHLYFNRVIKTEHYNMCISLVIKKN